jgi:hypothetical protein
MLGSLLSTAIVGAPVPPVPPVLGAFIWVGGGSVGLIILIVIIVLILRR